MPTTPDMLDCGVGGLQLTLPETERIHDGANDTTTDPDPGVDQLVDVCDAEVEDVANSLSNAAEQTCVRGTKRMSMSGTSLFEVR